MAHGGIEGHNKHRPLGLITEAGAGLHPRLPPPRERLVAVWAERPQAGLLREASPARAWGARCGEAGGHAGMVAAPPAAPLSAPRRRRVKTERRAAAALAHAWRLGADRPAPRTAAAQRPVRGGSPCARRGCGAVRGGAVGGAPGGAPLALACGGGARRPGAPAAPHARCQRCSRPRASPAGGRGRAARSRGPPWRRRPRRGPKPRRGGRAFAPRPGAVRSPHGRLGPPSRRARAAPRRLTARALWAWFSARGARGSHPRVARSPSQAARRAARRGQRRAVVALA